MRIAFLSHTAMGGPFVVGSHHLARTLHSLGHDVIHVSAPVSPMHLLAASGNRFVRQRVKQWWRGDAVVAGVKERVPFTWLPWSIARLARPLWPAYSRLTLPALPDWANDGCLIVDEPRFAGWVAQTNCIVVYRATDLYAALRGDSRILDVEKAVCERAQLLVATSEPVAEHLRRLSGKPVHVITNGVDFEHFAANAPSGSVPGSFDLPGSRDERAVYVGSFDRRFSRLALSSAVRTLPDKHFVLAGPGSHAVAEELALPNVIALGTVPYPRVAALLQQCAVGLLPLSTDAANDGRSPMKLYEYAAAGVTVAALGTTELLRRHLPTLCTCSSEEEFPRVVRAAFKLGTDPVNVAAAREVARSQSWAGKAKELLGLIATHEITASLPGVATASQGARAG